MINLNIRYKIVDFIPDREDPPVQVNRDAWRDADTCPIETLLQMNKWLAEVFPPPVSRFAPDEMIRMEFGHGPDLITQVVMLDPFMLREVAITRALTGFENTIRGMGFQVSEMHH